jgi:putative colanic acid biosynthesis glycosyltransferase
LHNLHGYYINIEILFRYLATANIHVVWTLHDCWSFTGHCTHFEYVGCEKWKTQCSSCPQKKEYPTSLLFDNSKQNYNRKKELFNSVKNLTIVAVSDWLKDKLKDSMLKKISARVIKNGIDIKTFKPYNDSELRIKSGLQNKFVILGVASTWTAKKGFNDFMQLSRELADDCNIILVGLSRKQLKQLPSKIIGIEKTENKEQLAHYYSMADLYVNPTYEDTFPTTNLEALACGTPVLTYKTGGSTESITSETGFIVKHGDILTIHQIIMSLKKEPVKFLKSNCRNEAVNQYNKEISFLKYFNLYQQITT